MTHELYSSGWPHYQENLHTLIFKIQSANQSTPALLSLHVSLRVGSFPAPPSWATCGDGTTCSVMEICCELVVRSNQSLQQVESWLKWPQGYRAERGLPSQTAVQDVEYKSVHRKRNKMKRGDNLLFFFFIVRVYILWFINVFKCGCTSFHAHTHALPAQASCFIDDYSGGLVFLLGELNNHILGPCA